ncbi:T9SS sorting signal type C domain-containing protein [Flavobacterium sp. N2270]|uniref:T9SS sorting signal type C domain-containing protein n=1 Tax=Flavobacterium sp. N2270 TaxID=2986831 RepID=UPI0022259CA9|nr:T9SS sorting signal type C domain-containing protein [Flavobacterium sp. N2270]
MKKILLKISTFIVLIALASFAYFSFSLQKKEEIITSPKSNDYKKTSPVSNVEEGDVVLNNKVSEVAIISSKKNLPTKESKIVTNDSIEQLRAKYSNYLRNHPFAKTKTLPKSERKAIGLPPNAFYEQEWLYTSNPVLGRPTPELVRILQTELEEQERLNRVPGDGLDNQWVERGPNNVGGRTRALMFAPGSTTKVFAGGVSGGLWINNDITSSASVWQQTQGVPSNIAVSCITVDPNNSNIMYIGTGEVYTWGAVNGNGVYKSIDGGLNWTNIFGAATSSNVRDNITYIQDIIAWNNPNTNQTEVFFGSDAMAYYDSVSGNPAWAWLGLNTIGLYRSTDGINFTRLENTSLKDSSSRNYAPNTFDIGADGKLWMGTKRSYTYPITGGMIFSTTNGTTWNLIRDFGTNGRVEVACSKTNANKIYVLLQNYATGYAEIKRTTDGFVSSNITITPPVSTGNQPPAANDFCRGQAFYDLMIGVNPTNDAEIYVGGIEVFKSTNSGGAWTQLSDWTVDPGSTNGSLDGMHSDQHCMAFASGLESRVVFGNDGGVYYSNNSGVTLIDRNNGYNVTQFYKGAISQSGTEKLLAGAQDNGSQLIVNTPGIGSSTEVFGGDGCWEFIDKQNEFMVTSYVYNSYHFVQYATNTATTYIANNTTDGDFVNQCGLDSNANILYANGTNGTTYRIYRYTINPAGSGSTTTATLTNSLLNDIPTYFEASPYTNNRMLVGLANGRLLQLNNANTTPTWTSIGDGSWVGAISDIRYGASNNEIFVTFHNYGTTNIWYTSNGGASWQNKEGDLPDLPVKCILQNPNATNEVIIGTELGVWYTTNFNSASPNWRRSNNGMKDVKVLSFDYRSSDNTILAATYGRGLFTGDFWVCGSTTTTWNGSTWSAGTPTKRVAAIFNGNYSSIGDLEACSVTVNGTAQVIFNTGHTLKVGEGVTVASGALLSIENNAALVQYSSTAVNSGNITVKRNSEAMIRQDYTAWSSPVSGQQLQSFSPNTLSNRFYQYLYTGTTTPTAYQSVTATSNFTVGKGYMIRSADNSSSTVPAVHNGVFTGVPTNGKLSSPIGIGYNLLGNPYPSPIDANRILITNPGLNTLYFWTHRVAASGGSYPVNNYASYTILGGAASQGGSIIPNGTIQTGQGFYIQARTADNVIFENEFRRDASTSTQFFRSSSASVEAEKHRIWLNLKGTDLDYNQILVGYMNGASSGIDQMIDGEVLDKSKTMIYNLISDNEYVIQGRALPFSDEDVVPLGLKVIEAGSYEISLENLDGLFVTQDVFIKDNLSGTLHDIKEGNYSFNSQAGTFNDRFELVYKNIALNNDSFENNSFVNTFSSNGILNVVSSKNNLKTVEVYDILGKVIYSNKNVNALEHVISSITTSNQTLIIKITLDNGKQVDKKVIF